MAGTDGAEEEEHGAARRSMRRRSGQGRRGTKDRGREGITLKSRLSCRANVSTSNQCPKGGFNKTYKSKNK
jgi:hypothetical protein